MAVSAIRMEINGKITVQCYHMMLMMVWVVDPWNYQASTANVRLEGRASQSCQTWTMISATVRFFSSIIEKAYWRYSSCHSGHESPSRRPLNNKGN
jgi:hypothetical protein